MKREITDSGMFDLAELCATIERESLQPQHDDALLGIGSAPLPPPRRDEPLVVRKVKSKLLPAFAFVAMFGSVAFAMHTSWRALELARAETIVVAEPGAVSVSASEASDDEAVAETEPEAEAETEAEAEVEAGAVAVAPVRRARAARSVPAPSAPAAELGERSVDELMRLATGLPEVPSSSPSTSAEAAPLRTLRPDRNEVAGVFRALAPAIQRCATDAEGVVTARVFLSGATGRARSASVTGVDGGEAACMESVLMRAEVDPFLQDRLEITFPYRL